MILVVRHTRFMFGSKGVIAYFPDYLFLRTKNSVMSRECLASIYMFLIKLIIKQWSKSRYQINYIYLRNLIWTIHHNIYIQNMHTVYFNFVYLISIIMETTTLENLKITKDKDMESTTMEMETYTKETGWKVG